MAASTFGCSRLTWNTTSQTGALGRHLRCGSKARQHASAPYALSRRVRPSAQTERYADEIENFEAFYAWAKTPGPGAQGGSDAFWSCIAPPQVDTPLNATRAGASLFVASDAEGLCRAASAMYPGDGQHAWRVACVDSKPMHLSKDRGNKEEHKSFEQEYKALEGVGLHSHQRVVLDWYLLSRTRELTSIRLLRIRCKTALGPGRGRLGAGESFYSWAHALGGHNFWPQNPVWRRCMHKCGPCELMQPGTPNRPRNC